MIPDESTPRSSWGKKARTRTGCWNCRRRRKKCDERRPTCTNCVQKRESCEWGLKLSFRSENVQTIPSSHPSMQRFAANSRDRIIEIHDVTSEVVRDYWNEACSSSSGQATDYDLGSSIQSRSSRSPTRDSTVPVDSVDSMTLEDTAADFYHTDRIDPRVFSVLNATNFDSPLSRVSSHSYDITQSAAEHLLALGRPNLSREVDMDEGPPQPQRNDDLLSPSMTGMPLLPGSSPAGISDDGIFLPGSAYLQLHTTLRSHIIDTARSTAPSRRCTPEPPSFDQTLKNGAPQTTRQSCDTATIEPRQDITPKLPELTQQEEYELWKNWTDELAQWLDKFDNECHFKTTLPLMARTHPHLRYSILACSARQMERKHSTRTSSGSLALYQEAIHRLMPELETKSTAVVASCVVLCVLEMMSCSPKAWRRHLDGCASLIHSIGMNGFSGGVEQAIFWCFARMDLCGGLISSERTLIPVTSWTPHPNLADASRLFRQAPHFDAYANYAVFLGSQVQNLFASDPSKPDYAERWSELFAFIEDWYTQRPKEMEPILSLNPDDSNYSRPFPIILFSNAPAISGNQLHHTSALLMLQRKPHGAVLRQKPRSVLWHARRICAISIGNTHHGCWTNCVQPLWLAGQVMSHPSEHRAILETYELIERETGWGTEWRRDDLKAFWGELDEG
ncbi:hypothetical protein K402DRAFT_325790 [Aulographum hederae CBS 113979]|uniref:Zn(2)-C6 fungal-type domain-containing protein n=1 Tax=Aulographum hederae CBS 113979 TaxID=1176131 RepID=A0A6G1HA30_9PEZI|nr:hypothetical protein K402DRAFT_325790 [Aulographum hederae CBS 113979]